MEQTVKQFDTQGMHKSAIIYRDDSACFFFVCFHCGITFDNINDTLQHIESQHFRKCPIDQLQLTDNATEKEPRKLVEYAGSPETVEIKVEFMGNDESNFENVYSSAKPIEPEIVKEQEYFLCKLCDTIYASKSLVRAHILRVHLDDNWSTYEAHIYDPNDAAKTDEAPVKLEVTVSEKRVSKKKAKNKTKSSKTLERPTDDAVNATETKKRTKSNTKTSGTTERPYKCHKCPQTWRKATELKRHFKAHAADDIMHLSKCKECEIYFKSDFELRLHVLDVHFMIKTFNCKVCSSEFTEHEAKQFEEHLHLHNKSDDVWSNISEGIGHDECDLTAYEECDSFAEEKHPCEFCAHKFFIKSNWDVHMNSVHSDQRRLQCGQCGSIFATPKYYYAHQLEHQRVGSNISEQDDSVLIANLNACIDERIIHNEDAHAQHPFRCLMCDITFEFHYEVRSHIRKQHVYKMLPPPIEPKKEFICDFCGITIKGKSSFTTHLLVHMPESKSHPCTICGKKFRQNADRIIHERQHTGEKPFQCHQCGKAFISKGLLTAHKKSHDDSTYPCLTCGRVFNLPSGYRRHIQTHREDRAFQCTICLKSFNTRLYLRKHMYTHDEKHIQCRFCELKFSTGDGRRQHERHRHKRAPN